MAASIGKISYLCQVNKNAEIGYEKRRAEQVLFEYSDCPPPDRISITSRSFFVNMLLRPIRLRISLN
jgi:hypothetical protein